MSFSLSPKPARGMLDQLINPLWNPVATVKPSYRIIIRSFIAAPTVGFGPSVFFGDARKPTAAVNSAVHFRAIQDFEIFINRGSSTLKIYEQPSSATIGIISVPTSFGFVPQVVTNNARTHHYPSIVRRVRSSTGRTTNSFTTSYWAKDPVTPQLFTPALDVHAQFSLTAYEESGILRVKINVIGDLFPSVEVLIVNPGLIRENILLGAHMEKGGLPDLFLDNCYQLITADLDLELDKSGGFMGVRHKLRPYTINAWNQEVIHKACQSK